MYPQQSPLSPPLPRPTRPFPPVCPSLLPPLPLQSLSPRPALSSTAAPSQPQGVLWPLRDKDAPERRPAVRLLLWRGAGGCGKLGTGLGAALAGVARFSGGAVRGDAVGCDGAGCAAGETGAVLGVPRNPRPLPALPGRAGCVRQRAAAAHARRGAPVRAAGTRREGSPPLAGRRVRGGSRGAGPAHGRAHPRSRAPSALCLSYRPSPRPAARRPPTAAGPPALIPSPMPGRPAMDVGRPRGRKREETGERGSGTSGDSGSLTALAGSPPAYPTPAARRLISSLRRSPPLVVTHSRCYAPRRRWPRHGGSRRTCSIPRLLPPRLPGAQRRLAPPRAGRGEAARGLAARGDRPRRERGAEGRRSRTVCHVSGHRERGGDSCCPCRWSVPPYFLPLN